LLNVIFALAAINTGIKNGGVSRGRRQFCAWMRIPVKWAADSGEVGQSRSEATLVVFLH
jgi:hypothetical protein